MFTIPLQSGPNDESKRKTILKCQGKRYFAGFHHSNAKCPKLVINASGNANS